MSPLISEPENSFWSFDEQTWRCEYVWPNRDLDFDFVGGVSLLPQHIFWCPNQGTIEIGRTFKMLEPKKDLY